MSLKKSIFLPIINQYPLICMHCDYKPWLWHASSSRSRRLVQLHCKWHTGWVPRNRVWPCDLGTLVYLSAWIYTVRIRLPPNRGDTASSGSENSRNEWKITNCTFRSKKSEEKIGGKNRKINRRTKSAQNDEHKTNIRRNENHIIWNENQLNSPGVYLYGWKQFRSTRT